MNLVRDDGVINPYFNIDPIVPQLGALRPWKPRPTWRPPHEFVSAMALALR